LGTYFHAYTHFKVTLHAFACSLVNGEPQPLEASELRWVKPPELSGFPMGKIDRQIAIRLNHLPVDMVKKIQKTVVRSFCRASQFFSDRH
jgi:hypothetical protein